MKILYGTGNPAKLQAMRANLSKLDIEIIGLKDMEGEIPNAPEDGKRRLKMRVRKHGHIFTIIKFLCFLVILVFT